MSSVEHSHTTDGCLGTQPSIPKFGPRLGKCLHRKHMEKLKTVKLYRFVGEHRERARCVNVLYVSTGEPDEGIDRIVEQMSVWGYTHKVNDVKKDSVDMSDPDGMLQACYDADVLIVGSSKTKKSAAMYLLNKVCDGWFGIMPHWDVLWYGLNGYVLEGGRRPKSSKKGASGNGLNGYVPEDWPEMLNMGPVCTGSDFAVDAIFMLHAHIRRRDDWAAGQGYMRLLWVEVLNGLAGLCRLSIGMPRSSSDVVKAFKEKLTADGMDGEPNTKMLFIALEMLENGCRHGISKATMMTDAVSDKLHVLGCNPEKLHGGHKRLLNLLNNLDQADSHSVEKLALWITYIVLSWIRTYRVERVWYDWHESVVGRQPEKSLLDSVKQWPVLGRNLTEKPFGQRLQAMVTALLDVQGINVVGVEYEKPTEYECGCSCPGCTGNTCLCGCVDCAGSGGYDVDIKVRVGCLSVKIQVGSFEGALNYDADLIKSSVSMPYGEVGGWADMDTASDRDTEFIRRKLRQTSFDGITLMINTVSGGMDRNPNVDWWYGGVKDKCLVLLDVNNKTSEIYHSAPKKLVNAATEVCRAFGSCEPTIRRIQLRPGPGERPPFCPDTMEGLNAAIQRDPGKWTADVTGALHYSEYVSVYCGSMLQIGGLNGLRGLIPTIRHAVDMHVESDGCWDHDSWGSALHNSLSSLDNILNESLEQMPAHELVDVARTLCNVVCDLHGVRSKGECVSHSRQEIFKRPHLYALDSMVRIIGRLGADAPPETLEALTTFAGFGKREDGRGCRIVLSTRLNMLIGKQPEWYADNEALLFGASDGLDVDLMGAYMMNNNCWVQIMKKYPHLAREAVRNASEGRYDNRMYVFMSYVLSGIKGYGMRESIQFLSDAGVLEVAASVCAWWANDEAKRPSNKTKHYEACIRFWETALECVPEQAGKFGAMELADSIRNDDWKRLMLRSCKLAGGNMVRPTSVVVRAVDGGFDDSNAQIIELVLRAQPRIVNDLAVQRALSMIPNGIRKPLLDKAGLTVDVDA